MELLWAPWRVDYILGEKTESCLFCLKIEEKRDRDNLILQRAKRNMVMMNRYPYNNGHLLVFPYKHSRDLEGLDDEEIKDLLLVVSRSTTLLKKALNPDGFNIGMNLGRISGAGIEEHLHFHIVPRWSGDTNFMPVLAETRVMPEHLAETYRKLSQLFVNF